jgi:hypothetical protein
MAVILIDVEAGTTSIVPGSLTTNRFGFPNVAWASDGGVGLGRGVAVHRPGHPRRGRRSRPAARLSPRRRDRLPGTGGHRDRVLRDGGGLMSVGGHTE